MSKYRIVTIDNSGYYCEWAIQKRVWLKWITIRTCYNSLEQAREELRKIGSFFTSKVKT